jgi:hypothetical protein
VDHTGFAVSESCKITELYVVLFVHYSSNIVENPPESLKRNETLKAWYQGTK